MTPIFMLVYTSKASRPIDAYLLKDILLVSHKYNLRDEITGFLTVREGYFLQLLEGPETLVRECYRRIKADPRHYHIVLQGEAYSESRMMPDWSMGLVEFEERNNSGEGIIELFKLAQNGRIYSSPHSLVSMLRMFSRDAKILVP